MNAATALANAKSQFPYGPRSCEMAAAIKNMEEDPNGSDYGDLGFSMSDVHLQIAYELCQLTQRDKDLLCLANFFKFAWTTLHKELVFERRKPTSYEKGIILNVFRACGRLGCSTAFLDDGDENRLSDDEFQDVVYRQTDE